MSGIIYKERLFSEPVEFGEAPLSRTQGIFAILVRDAGWWPQQYRVIYFGETDNLVKNVTSQHERYHYWLREAAGAPLYVAVHTTARMKAQKRKEAEYELIRECNPACNEHMELSVA
jgi:hypothetical protein